MNYSRHYSTRATPQSQPIPGTNQIPNSAGGYSFPVDDWVRLHRFLVLGSEGGSYYTTEKKLTIQNSDVVVRCARTDGARTVATIVSMSENGRIPKNDTAIFALAICAGMGDTTTRNLALASIPHVCRTGTHLFQFVEAVTQFRGWGRGLRSAIGDWYTSKDIDSLSYQLVKYQQRNGWSHRDLLRLSHPHKSELDSVLGWVVGKEITGPLPRIVEGLLAINSIGDSVKDAIRIIHDYRLPRECVPTQFLKSAVVWEVLLEDMPITAMIRNLPTMTRVGLLTGMTQATRTIIERLGDVNRLRKGRVHPIALLTAQLTYASGQNAFTQRSHVLAHSFRHYGESLGRQWEPVQQIVDALDGAYYTSFGLLTPTNKRWCVAIDVSGSMQTGVVAGIPGLTPNIAAAAMAMVTLNTESLWEAVGFSNMIKKAPISPRMRLNEVTQAITRWNGGGTDCSLPMKWALENRIGVDVFAIYTDSETWYGQDKHPIQALREYREKMGIAAKMVVVGMVANSISIADPNDAGTMDVVGFDTATPDIITNFVKEGF